MRPSWRFTAVLLVALVEWSAPRSGQAQGIVQYTLQSETRLAGILVDPARGQPVSFLATSEDGALTVRIDLESQSVTVRQGPGEELHIDSSRNTDRAFSTLSDDDRRVIRELVTLMDEDLRNTNSFYASTICMLRHLSAWPAGMPLAVSFDALMRTVGDVSVPIEEIEEARRRAMTELRAQAPAEVETDDSIVSLCKQIGKTAAACYPTSLYPLEEKCENVLVGGTACTGRCGTTCKGLCSGTKYTRDCADHDRCADVYSRSHRYCNFIFPAAFDDCTDANDCNDVPGIWTFTGTWKGGKPWTATVNLFVTKRFTSGSSSGTWASTETDFRLSVTDGCNPLYSGKLNGTRLSITGTMKCRKGSSNSGTWKASKTNGILSDPLTADETDGPTSTYGVAGSAGRD